MLKNLSETERDSILKKGLRQMTIKQLQRINRHKGKMLLDGNIYDGGIG